ncbi:hypothetical protein [Kineosporia sp. R_H_3]|uniref:hypothetical protein n=1 Tax=Kineosporia sp. R_H_3 TaxID=1961848 RepID=UPI000B4BE442|nr:hypothetical protein [Kineosporia sp. R_H_3]
MAGALLLSCALVVESLALLLLGLQVSADVQAGCGGVIDPYRASLARRGLTLLLALGIAPWLVAVGLTRQVRWLGAGVVATVPAWVGLLQAYTAPERFFGPWFCF